MNNNFFPVLLLPGYYYDLDESYDESDEEEVKAHLRRVTEQPPLKLDTSSEVRKHCTSGFYVPIFYSSFKIYNPSSFSHLSRHNNKL